MRLYIGLFAIITLIVVIDIVFYFLFLRKYRYRKTWQKIIILGSLTYIAFWVFLFASSPKSYQHLQPDNYQLFFLAFTLMVIFYVPRIISITIKLLLRIPQALNLLKQKFVNRLALIIGAIALALSVSGVFIVRFQFRVIEQNIEHASIPKTFDNYKIVQISDLHLGTATSYKLSFIRMVNKINALNPDIVVFTGDLVNNFASELDGWNSILDKINAKTGVYAILGNHDYGDYVSWTSPSDKHQNFVKIVSFFKTINWKLLRNESVPLIRDNDTIILAGVENWGNPPFPRYGNLNQTVSDSTHFPIILLSHDPSHWDEEIIKHPANIFLTLSGHTHGFQVGIRSQNINISPVSLKYEKWGGLYETNNKYLYVNVGAGTIGFPGRIGMRPEITLITLKHTPQK